MNGTLYVNHTKIKRDSYFKLEGKKEPTQENAPRSQIDLGLSLGFVANYLQMTLGKFPALSKLYGLAGSDKA